MMQRKAIFPVFAVCAILVAAPLVAQEEVIQAGIDGWHTPNDGSTFITVNLPQGFFCPGSAPVGQIALKGEPLETDPPVALGDTDTVVQRLNDTTTGGKTQIQVQALCLKGADVLRVSCGDGSFQTWDVAVGLDGEQPITEILIEQVDDEGGVFNGTVDVNAVITFTQTSSELSQAAEDDDGEPRGDGGAVGGSSAVKPGTGAVGETITVNDKVSFASVNTPWVFDPGIEAVRYEGDIFVGEGCGAPPLRPLPGTSNFHPGWGQGTPAQISKSKCKCECKCGRFCRLPVREQALLAQHGVIPPCRRCNCL